jgi:cell wall-associated NlpC family hydrolase
MRAANRFPGLLSACLAAWLLAGCSTPRPTPDVAARSADAAVRASQPRLALLEVASAQVGTPYRYGGDDRRGFDCSGLVQFSHREIGLAVPRTTLSQWREGLPVQSHRLQPGDLVFFAVGPGKQRHVGIYEGGGRFIHAPSSGKRVGRASLDNPYWRTRLIGGRTFF